MAPEESSASSSVVRWMDAPWLIAAFLGIWGAMLGIEHFTLANASAATAIVFACVRLAKDTLIWTRKRRTVSFIFWLVTFLVLLGADFKWTATLKAESEAKGANLEKLGEIPKLQKTIDQLNVDAAKNEKAHEVEQGRLQQRLDDIGDDNKALKSSIEKKDAVLAKIAQDQFALNFTPQVTVQTDDAKDEIKFVNDGKTNIELREFRCTSSDGYTLTQTGIPDTAIAPGAWTSMKADEPLMAHLATAVPADTDGRVPFQCSSSVMTLDKRRYLFPFTWIFVVKDSVVTRSYGIGHSMTEIKK